MIDKLDLRVPRRTPFTPAFQRKYAELRALEKGPFRAGKFYEYAGDLREYGHSLRLNMFCQMEKAGNHKIELIDVGLMSRTQILREIGEVFDIGSASLGVMRVDFAVDIPDLPVRWFRETVQVNHKRFRSAVTGERFYSEMGNGGIQTLYFGKRPNVIRIYDKTAESKHQFRNILRNAGPGFEPTFESVFPTIPPDAILTRVERQIGGRIPAGIESLQELFESGFEYKPFEKLKIIDHSSNSEFDSRLSFETYSTVELLRRIAQEDGMQAMKDYVSKRSHGNAGWVWRKYGPHLDSVKAAGGITTDELQKRFEQSMRQQLSS